MTDRPSEAPSTNPEDLDLLKGRLDLFIKLKCKGVAPNHLCVNADLQNCAADLVHRYDGKERDNVINILFEVIIEHFVAANKVKPMEQRAEVFRQLFRGGVIKAIETRANLRSGTKGIGQDLMRAARIEAAE